MDEVKELCIKQGYVPLECKLDGRLVWALVNDGRNPCIGCNAICVHKRADFTPEEKKCMEEQFQEWYEENKKKQQKYIERIEKRRKLRTNSQPFIYVDVEYNGAEIVAILPNLEEGYVKFGKESPEKIAMWIETMCLKHKIKQVIIPLNGLGVGIYDCLVRRKLDWLDTVPIKCMGERLI